MSEIKWKSNDELREQSSFWRKVLGPTPKGPRKPRPEEVIKVRKSKKLTKLEKDIELRNKEISELRERAKEETRNQRIVCPHCSKQPKLRDCVYIQTYWYTPPRGCTGGDYWNQGEGQFRCPHCSKVTRLYQKPEIAVLKWAFGSVEEKHD